MRLEEYRLILGSLKNRDTITIPLPEQVNGYVGLVEATFNNFNLHSANENFIDITCDQLETSFENPTRLLRRVPFLKFGSGEYMHTWKADHIIFQKFSSQDKFLTLKFNRSDSGKPLTFINRFGDSEILISLAFFKETEPYWTNHI